MKIILEGNEQRIIELRDYLSLYVRQKGIKMKVVSGVKEQVTVKEVESQVKEEKEVKETKENKKAKETKELKVDKRTKAYKESLKK